MLTDEIINITNYITKQIINLFPDGNIIENLDSNVLLTLNNNDFSRIKSWVENPRLDVMNSIQYPIFLYKLSRQLFLSGDIKGATKIFYLNKVLHGIDLFYEIDLKNDFLLR